jgi:hypothetical protein
MSEVKEQEGVCCTCQQVHHVVTHAGVTTMGDHDSFGKPCAGFNTAPQTLMDELKSVGQKHRDEVEKGQLDELFGEEDSPTISCPACGAPGYVDELDAATCPCHDR